MTKAPMPIDRDFASRCPMQRRPDPPCWIIIAHLNTPPAVSIRYPAHHRATNAPASVVSRKYIEAASF
jgi:hypothetical protein